MVSKRRELDGQRFNVIFVHVCLSSYTDIAIDGTRC